MDQIDCQILSLLHQNARMSIAEMSRRISMSQPTVKERLLKLEDKGVITGYRARFSAEKLGKHTMAFVLFKTNRCKDFVAFSEQSPEIVELYRISGEYNYLMKVVTSSNQTLAAFLDTLSQYGFSTTLIVLSTIFDDKSLVSEECPEE